MRATVLYATEATATSPPEWDLQVVGSVSAGAQKGSNWGSVQLIEHLAADLLKVAGSDGSRVAVDKAGGTSKISETLTPTNAAATGATEAWWTEQVCGQS